MSVQTIAAVPVFSGKSTPGTEHVNHDRWGAVNRTAWVIDGATRTSSAPISDYVASLDAALTAHAADDSLSLSELLASAIAQIAADYSGTNVSATVAMARQRPHGGWDWLVLGDSAVAYADENGTHLIQDTRLACVGVAQRARKRAIELHELDGAHLKDAKAALLAAEDAARNVRGGFWVAADRPDAAMHAVTGSTSAEDLVLMTDGVVSGFAAGTWDDAEQMVHDVLHAGPEHVLQNVHRDVMTAHGQADDMTLVHAHAS